MQRFSSQVNASDALLAGRIVPGERFMIAGERHRVVDEKWFTADECGESHPVRRLSCRLRHGHDGGHWTHGYTWSQGERPLIEPSFDHVHEMQAGGYVAGHLRRIAGELYEFRHVTLHEPRPTPGDNDRVLVSVVDVWRLLEGGEWLPVRRVRFDAPRDHDFMP